MQANGNDPVEREMYMLEKKKETTARAKTGKWEGTGHREKGESWAFDGSRGYRELEDVVGSEDIVFWLLVFSR